MDPGQALPAQCAKPSYEQEAPAAQELCSHTGLNPQADQYCTARPSQYAEKASQPRTPGPSPLLLRTQQEEFTATGAHAATVTACRRMVCHCERKRSVGPLIGTTEIRELEENSENENLENEN